MAGRALGLCAVLLLLAGCGGDGEAETSAPALAAERFGYIRSVDTSTQPTTLEFDEAEWLTGDAAQQAAEADGAIPPGEPVPNDYYVRNPDTSTHTLEIAPDAAVTATRCDLCRGGEPGELEPFLAAFSEQPQTYAADYRGARSQYWLRIENGRVLSIDEQYVP